MAINIRDQHLEQQIDRIRVRRGDATLAKTACDLVRERLTMLQFGLDDIRALRPEEILELDRLTTKLEATPDLDHEVREIAARVRAFLEQLRPTAPAT